MAAALLCITNNLKPTDNNSTVMWNCEKQQILTLASSTVWIVNQIVDDSFCVDRWTVSTATVSKLKIVQLPGDTRGIYGRGFFQRQENTLLYYHFRTDIILNDDDSHGLISFIPAMVDSVNIAQWSSHQAGSRFVLRVPLKDDTMDCHSVHHVIHSRVQTVQSFNYSTWPSMGDRQWLIITGLISP